MCVTAELDVTPKTAEQHGIVCTGKFKVGVNTAREVLYY